MMTFMLKTMAELLADGWSVEVGIDGTKSLKKDKCSPLPEKHWSRLGGLIGLNKDLDGQRGFFCVERFKWSRMLIKEMVSRGPVAAKPDVKPCTCDIKALMDYGCRCGGFQREKRA